jgi:hypothetical protein
LNDRELASHAPAALHEGDRLKVGPLEFLVSFVPGQTPPIPPALPSPSSPGTGDPDDHDRIAAMLLGMDGDEDRYATPPGETPIEEPINWGQTLFRFDGVPKPSPPSAQSANAATEILRKMMRRPRPPEDRLDELVRLLARQSVYVSDADAQSLANFIREQPQRARDSLARVGRPVIVVDIATLLEPPADLLEQFCRRLYAALIDVHRLHLEATDYHAELIPQIFRDEPPALICVLGLEHARFQEIAYIRGLQQNAQRVLLVGKNTYYDQHSSPL